MFPPSTDQSGFRRSNCLRRAFNSFYRSRSMNPPPPPKPRTKRPSSFMDYRTLSRIFRRQNLSSAKEGFSVQQCASILLPIIFCTLLVVVCVVAALALLTDGFSLCHCRTTPDEHREFEVNGTDLCLTNECIQKAHYLLERIDRRVQPCENFYHFACGSFRPTSSLDHRTRFESELRAKLEQRPRPSFPLPYRLLFDFYDSCINEEPQEQLSTQPFNTLISRLGGWALLQNAKFDVDSFEWEALEQQLNSYGVDGLFAIRIDPVTNTISITNPSFLLVNYRRQNLEEYFSRLLTEMDVDEELALTAVQEALDLESNLIEPPKPTQKQTLQQLKERFPKIQWDKFTFPLTDSKDQTEFSVHVEYLEHVQSQLNGANQTVANYLMLRLLHSISANLPRRYRAIRERLDNKFEPRWQVCFEEILNLMPLPLYGFGFQLQQQNGDDNLKKFPQLIAKSKEQVGKQIRSLPWIDAQTKEKMIKNLHNLRIIPNLLSSSQTEVQIRTLYSGERLDPTSYFDNVLMLRQTNARMAYSMLHGNRDWTRLILNENPETNTESKELVFGPVSLFSLVQMPDSVKNIQLRRHILEFLFHSDAITQWKPEPRSILKAKFHCFEKDLNLPNLLIYDQMALQAAASDEKTADGLKLPGLSDYSPRQLMYISFAASRCNKAGATSESERSMNHVLQQLDEFADTFQCPVSSKMNPRDKCSIL